MITFTPLLLTSCALLLLSGCSYRTSNFFEDLIADTKVIKAQGQYNTKVDPNYKAPIMNDRTQSQKKHIDKPIKAKGRILKVNFDKDFNLYVYTFFDTMKQKAITFYYDKNIKYTPRTTFEVIVQGNYLHSIKKINYTPKKEQEALLPTNNAKKEIKKAPPSRTKYKRRRRSPIKIPIEEKINTL